MKDVEEIYPAPLTKKHINRLDIEEWLRTIGHQNLFEQVVAALESGGVEKKEKWIVGEERYYQPWSSTPNRALWRECSRKPYRPEEHGPECDWPLSHYPDDNTPRVTYLGGDQLSDDYKYTNGFKTRFQLVKYRSISRMDFARFALDKLSRIIKDRLDEFEEVAARDAIHESRVNHGNKDHEPLGVKKKGIQGDREKILQDWLEHLKNNGEFEKMFTPCDDGEYQYWPFSNVNREIVWDKLVIFAKAAGTYNPRCFKDPWELGRDGGTKGRGTSFFSDQNIIRFR